MTRYTDLEKLMLPYGCCPTYCRMISRMQRVPFQNLKRSYIRNEGDIRAVLRYAREWERNREEKQGKAIRISEYKRKRDKK